MKALFTVLSLPFIAGASLSAQVTIVVNAGGFADPLGVPTNGMPYGVVIDTAGDGLATGWYAGFDLGAGAQYLSTSSGVTDDWFTLPSGESDPLVTQDSFVFGAGTISTFRIDSGPGVAGDSFGLVWFPDSIATAGASYGFATYSDLRLVSSGQTVTTTDALNPGAASYSFDGDLTAIPEPSSLVFLVALIAAGSVVRRRR